MSVPRSPRVPQRYPVTAVTHRSPVPLPLQGERERGTGTGPGFGVAPFPSRDRWGACSSSGANLRICGRGHLPRLVLGVFATLVSHNLRPVGDILGRRCDVRVGLAAGVLTGLDDRLLVGILDWLCGCRSHVFGGTR